MAGVREIGRKKTGSAENKSRHDSPRKKVEAQHGKAERHSADAEPCKHHTDDVESLILLGTMFVGTVMYRMTTGEVSPKVAWSVFVGAMGAIALLFRSARVIPASPAVLRLQIESSRDRTLVRVLKRRGSSLPTPVALDLRDLPAASAGDSAPADRPRQLEMAS